MDVIYCHWAFWVIPCWDLVDLDPVVIFVRKDQNYFVLGDECCDVFPKGHEIGCLACMGGGDLYVTGY